MALAASRFFTLEIRSELNKLNRVQCLKYFSSNPEAEADPPVSKERFRRLELYPEIKYEEKLKTPAHFIVDRPRSLNMTPDQDWSNVWPGPRTFHPATVPLPLRQGCNKHGPSPGKFGNTELMKIPNFLHLTPPAIEKHCNAIKKFCTEWPENLKTDEDIEKHFPVEVIDSDYCHASSSIRDPKARIISLKIKLKNLELDAHAKDKILRLLGSRYDPETDYITITTDACPLKKQNYDYAHYLLTAVFFEAWKVESWEKEKSDDDMEEYIFSKRKTFKNLKAVFDYNKKTLPNLGELGKTVEEWINKGDNKEVIENYKKAMLKVLSLPPLEESK